ncbi:MAG: hypothetical protein HY909_05160 [Deltaproteobacteria bacterium]|nr:hypothetical protein [Deltaproteobacteria bacterium]
MRTKSPRAMLLLALGCGLPAAGAPREASAQSLPGDEGRVRFQEGRGHFDQRRFAEALEAFEASLRALPSPNTRMYIGRSLRELGRTAEAFTALEEAAREALDRARVEPRYARTAETARTEASALRALLAVLTVQVPEPVTGLSLTLNGASLELSRVNTEVPLRPGVVTLEARAPGFRPWQATHTLEAGQGARLEVRLVPEASGPALPPPPPPVVLLQPQGPRGMPPPVPPPPPSNTLRIVGFVTMGVGLVAGLGGVLAGLSAQSVDQDLTNLCPTRCPRALIAEDLSLGESRATLSTAGFITAGALVGVGLIMVLAAPGGSPRPVVVYTPELARVTPWVDPAGGAGVGLRGRF